MRLTKEKREKAKAELLTILLHGSQITGKLRGTPQFHGGCTLSNYQIRTLLRETGKVDESVYGDGMYTSTLWSLKPEAVEQVKKDEERHYEWHKKHGEHAHDMKEWGENHGKG